MARRRVLGIVLAGGAGSRLAPLTVGRCKPAVSFGGRYRLIDFALSNLVNGGCRDIFVLTPEKPADPPAMAGRPGQTYASMGNYLFDADVLADAVRKDTADDTSRHDMGGDVIPTLAGQGAAHAYDFRANQLPGATARDAGYWRDAGTLDSYYGAQMDLCAPRPAFNLANSQWPILPQVRSRPPIPVRDRGGRAGRVVSSLVSSGANVSGGLVGESVLAPGVRVGEGASVKRAVLLHYARIGPRAVIRHAIVDENAVVPGGVRVGVDKQHDRARGLLVSPGGVTIVGKGQQVPP